MKILIVDDEMPIRQWFAYSIANHTGHTVVGVAANGTEALELFLREKPDVVITDIRMPKMDGLELSMKIREISPQTDIVILTCHDEFQYARKAVGFGAFAYLLKTEVDDEKIKNLLEEVEKHQNRSRQQSQVEKEALHSRYNKLIRRIVDMEPDDARLQEMFEKQQIHIEPSCYWFVIALEPDAGGEIETERAQMDAEVPRVVSMQYSDKRHFLFCNMGSTVSFLYLNYNIHRFASRMIAEYGGRIGISRMFQGVSQLKNAVDESVLALEYFFYTNRTIDDYNSMLDKRAGEEVLGEIYRVWYQELPKLNEEQLVGALRELFGNVKAACYVNVERTKKLAERALDAVCYTLGILEGVDWETEKKIYEAENLEELQEVLVSRVEDIIDSGVMRYSQVVSDAVSYIHNHYAKQISLDELAARAYLNSQYFSRIFKEETGENFSVFLMNYRLRKAEQLLRNTDMKVCEVAEMVGYGNLSYFSKIYKKFFGTTPKNR